MNIQEESQENQSSMNSHMQSSVHGHREGEMEDEDEPMLENVEDADQEDSKDKRKQGSDERKKQKESKDPYQAQFDAFLNAFQNESNVDQKLQLAIQFMETALAQGGTPHFRHFWEARRLCLPLFKENISPALRTQLWNKYSELSKEARRLKDILDEQSAFAIEQIEMAVKALEQDIEQFDAQVDKNGFPSDFPFPNVLNNKYELYEGLQKQLNILNVQASRINALRKELLKTEMRVRQKNKFFQRLSLAGDKVFPLRKDLIKQISQQFNDDITDFVNHYFQQNLDHEASLYALREEIKALQGLAKILTLNTNAFTQTRMRLSECWDQVKVQEKERKKERAQQKVAFKHNADAVVEKIQAAKESFESGETSVMDANHKIDEISQFMRSVELGREHVKELKDKLQDLRKLIQEKAKSEEKARYEQENERNLQKKEKYKALKEEINKVLSNSNELDAEKLIAERDRMTALIQESALTKNEKQELERLLKPIKDIITEKKEKALLDLSEDDRQALQQLQEVLQQRKTRRQEIRNQLESLRKMSGSSSLDFEKAMAYNAQISEEKERLDKISQGILEIENKIAELQSKK